MLKQKPVNMNGKRSIDLLVEAMFKLMEEKPFQSITISELTRSAGVVRNTFYAHFNTKTDVLTYYIFSVFENGLKAYDEDRSFDYKTMGAFYFDVWSENMSFLKLLEQNDMLSVLNDFENQLDALGLTEKLNASCPVSDKAYSYLGTFYASALVSVIKRWVKTGMQETPKELNEIYMELTGVELFTC
ncbi:TetR/AcrR family transcriptional regulator [Vallitaleaceae bacterium 9-2]